MYHTNVMMWIGTDVAAVCLDSITDETVTNLVLMMVMIEIVKTAFCALLRCAQTLLTYFGGESTTVQLTTCFSDLDSTKQVDLFIIFTQSKPV